MNPKPRRAWPLRRGYHGEKQVFPMRMILRRSLNLLLYLSFCVLAGTGLLMAFRLIPGSRGGRGLHVLSWDRHQWGDFHTWFAYAFMALVCIHLAMNWAWLAKVAARGRLWRLVLGLILGAAIVIGFLFLPVTHRRGGHGRFSTTPNILRLSGDKSFCTVASTTAGFAPQFCHTFAGERL